MSAQGIRVTRGGTPEESVVETVVAGYNTQGNLGGYLSGGVYKVDQE